MKNLKNVFNIKSNLVRLSEEELVEYLDNDTYYYKFIECFSNMLLSDNDYVFSIYRHIPVIASSIEKKSEDRGKNIYEKFIFPRLQFFTNIPECIKDDFKSQYDYSYLYKIGVPFAIRNDSFYEECMLKNNENYKKIERMLYNSEYSLKNKMVGDITTLVTVNTILKEAKTFDQDMFMLLIDIVSEPVFKDDYLSRADYRYYKMYQYKTLKALRKIGGYSENKMNIKTLIK